MSDPYLNCDHCGDQCACRATRDELERYKEALQALQAEAIQLLSNYPTIPQFEMFVISVKEKVGTALAEPKE